MSKDLKNERECFRGKISEGRMFTTEGTASAKVRGWVHAWDEQGTPSRPMRLELQGGGAGCARPWGTV